MPAQEASRAAEPNRAMSTPTSAIRASAVRRSTDGMVSSSATCWANGAIPRVDLGRQRRDGLVQEVQLGQDLADQQRVVGAKAALEHLAQPGGSLLRSFPPGQLGQHTRVAGAGDQRLKHVSAGAAKDVAGHAGQLDPGVLQDLVQPLAFPGALLDLGLGVAGQVVQLAVLFFPQAGRALYR